MTPSNARLYGRTKKSPLIQRSWSLRDPYQVRFRMHWLTHPHDLICVQAQPGTKVQNSYLKELFSLAISVTYKAGWNNYTFILINTLVPKIHVWLTPVYSVITR